MICHIFYFFPSLGPKTAEYISKSRAMAEGGLCLFLCTQTHNLALTCQTKIPAQPAYPKPVEKVRLRARSGFIIWPWAVFVF